MSSDSIFWLLTWPLFELVTHTLFMQECLITCLHQYHCTDKNKTMDILSGMRMFLPVKHKSLSKWYNVNWKKKKIKSFFPYQKKAVKLNWSELTHSAKPTWTEFSSEKFSSVSTSAPDSLHSVLSWTYSVAWYEFRHIKNSPRNHSIWQFG